MPTHVGTTKTNMKQKKDRGMAQIVIIGAGLTGISAAYHLEQKGFFDYKLFEKEPTIGGLCRSIEQDGFTFDFTGHLLHINNDYFRSLIDQIVGFEHFNTIDRRSWIYSQNVYTPYPYQVNMRGLPTSTIAECLEGFIKRPVIKKPKTFYEWVLTNFGKGFGKYFFFDYQRKIFAYDIKKITASWTGRFVPSTSLEQLIEGIVGTTKEQNIGYNAQFLYPSFGGISYWVEKLAHTLVNPIYTNFCVDSIDMRNKIIHFANGHAEPYEQLITSIPLDQLLLKLKEPSDISLSQAHKNLLCNSVVNFNLGIAQPNISDKHWIYFPETKYPFYRIGFPHNFASSMAPEGCSSLYGEFSYIKKSKTYIAQQLKASLLATKKLLNISDTEIICEKILYIPHAYVIYDAWREKNLPLIHKKLHEFNIYSVGRYGEWKYSSMQEAVLDGKAIAEKLLILPAIHTHFIEYMEHPITKEKTL